MELCSFKFDLKRVKRDLLTGIKECRERGLYNSVKWFAELNQSISHVQLEPDELPTFSNSTYSDSYELAKSYLDLKEYDRCCYLSENSNDPLVQFVNLYARYLSIEKKKLDNMTDLSCASEAAKNEPLKRLCVTLKEAHIKDQLDGFGLYLYGVVLKKLDLNPSATTILVEAINKQPLHWGAWQELAYLITERGVLSLLNLPDHWMKTFFYAYVYLEQLCNDEALSIYENLNARGFQKSTYIMSQMAIAYHNRRDLDKAIGTFKELLQVDPYRLDNLDTYSNLLYVKEMKVELADLAHSAIQIDKYRVETCCVIGNYYSLSAEHAKAALYFQRALKLNPQYLSAWTLMGHEFMELKNTSAAIQSYRRAIEVNHRDYRAWYGLGQTYEILKMPFYCMYYYKQAQQLRPNDSRMIIALGETYEKLGKNENALKCYYKACNVGDIEGTALIKLAKLYDKLNDVDNAAAAFTEYCLKDERMTGYEAETEFYNAFYYLAEYHHKKGQLEEAYAYAYKCIEHDETKEQGKALLKTIAACRGEQETESLNMANQHKRHNVTTTTTTASSSVECESNMDMTFSP